MEEKFSSYTIDENESFVPESKNKVLSNKSIEQKPNSQKRESNSEVSIEREAI